MVIGLSRTLKYALFGLFLVGCGGGGIPTPGAPVQRSTLCGTDKFCGLGGTDVIYPGSSPMYIKGVERVLGRKFRYGNVALGGDRCAGTDVQPVDWDSTPLAHWTADYTLDTTYESEFKVQLKAAIAGSLSAQAKADAKIDALLDRVVDETTHATQHLDINVYALNDDGVDKQKNACGDDTKDMRFARKVTVAMLDTRSKEQLQKDLKASIELHAEVAASKENASADAKANVDSLTKEVVEKAANGLLFVVALGFRPVI